MLESELKAKSDHIRTIIKARGISYPNITGKTFAVFRVDNRHHLMSIVSMIDPSPDWIVGVSSLELCQRNCSWIESKVLNLYPWDVGTDDGITYLSPNQPSSPRLSIRRVKTNVPNDSRSPFFDATNTAMKPFARLTLTRQRLYEKSCDATPKEDSEDDSSCETEGWSGWSSCSVTCGRGIKYKQRRYKHEGSKFKCHKKLTDRASCEAVQKYCPHKPVRQFEDPLCELGPWSEWSSCSTSCGKGTMTRDRKYKNRFAAKTCAAGKVKTALLQQNLECWGEGDCEDSREKISEDCPEKPWSNWSPCSVTCGRGYKERYRLSLDHKSAKSKFWPLYDTYQSKSMEEFDEDDPCNNFIKKESVECYEKQCQERDNNVSMMACGLPKDPGSCKSDMDRWYFDTLKGRCEIFTYSGCGGNSNNFNTLEQCQTLCSKYQKEMLVNSTKMKKELGISVSGVMTYNIQNDPNALQAQKNKHSNEEGDFESRIDSARLDCDVSKWSNWGSCVVASGDCGIGHKEKFRVVLRLPMNGGLPCPETLVKRKRCKVFCKFERNGAVSYPNDNKIESSCIMSSWFPWSECGKNCELINQYRIRYAVATPGSEEYECEDEVQKRRCDCG